MNGWHLWTTIIAVIVFASIVVRGLSYSHKYRGPAPLMSSMVFGSGVALAFLGFAVGCWNIFLVIQRYFMQGSLVQDEQIIRYTVIGHVVYITLGLLWFSLLLYMASKYRPAMKAVLSSAFIGRRR